MSKTIEKLVNKDYWLSEEGRASLRTVLGNGVIEVVFKKAGGDNRSMNCTLKTSELPEFTTEDKKESVRKPNLDACPVFDVDKKEWRSFRWDSILQVSIPAMLIVTE